MRTQLYFVTGNEGKAKEAEEILGCKLRLKKLDIPEIQSLDIALIAREKAYAAFEVLKQPLIVDDVGVYIKAWRGLPGPFVKYFKDTLGVSGIIRLLKHEKNRDVEVKASVGYHDGKTVHVFTARIKGHFSPRPRGRHGFGWDPLFVPNGSSKTYAEMTREEKNALSHRRKALEKLKKFLAKKG